MIELGPTIIAAQLVETLAIAVAKIEHLEAQNAILRHNLARHLFEPEGEAKELGATNERQRATIARLVALCEQHRIYTGPIDADGVDAAIDAQLAALGADMKDVARKLEEQGD